MRLARRRDGEARGRRRHLTTIILVVAMVALALVLHLGVGAGLLATAPWASWVVYLAIPLVVLLKIGLFIFGKHAHRRRSALDGDNA